MTQRSYVDITPDTNLIDSFQAQQWSVAPAIAEAVDNSFGEGRGNAKHVRIAWDSKTRRLTILDDGQGMNSPADLFQLGKTQGRSVRDIGKYGYGGTSMCLWLASEVEVWTLRDGKVASAVADWSKVRASGAWRIQASQWVRARPDNTPAQLFDVRQGTFIVLTVPRHRTINPTAIQGELARIYAPAMRMGRRIVWENHRPHQTERIDLTALYQVPDDARSFVLVIPTPHGDLTADGRIWLDPSATTEESHLAIAYGPRVIKRTRDCYSSADGLERYGGVGVIGFLDLGEGWQDYLTTTKSDIRDDTLYAALMEALFLHFRPMLQLAQEQAEQVQLADLALNLAVGLDGVFDVEVEVPAGVSAPERQYSWHKPEEPTGAEVPPIIPRREPELSGPGDERRIEHHKAAARLWVEFVPGARLSGTLFDITSNGDNITVYLNRDHEDVRHARERKTPTQQRMLYALLVPAVSTFLLEDGDLRDRALSKSVRKRLDTLDGNRISQVSFLNGLLLSGAKAVA